MFLLFTTPEVNIIHIYKTLDKSDYAAKYAFGHH